MGALEEALTEAYEKIEKSKSEAERLAAAEEARDKVRNKTKVFGDVKEEFEDAERMLNEGEDKEEAKEEAVQCDDLAQQLLDTLDDKLRDAMDNAGDNDDHSDQDLL